MVSSVQAFLAEDIGRRDITTEALVSEETRGSASIVARTPAIVAGLDIARSCFQELDDSAAWNAVYKDGDQVEREDIVAIVSGNLRALLSAERTALNLLSRLSGIATATGEVVDRVKDHDVV